MMKITSPVRTMNVIEINAITAPTNPFDWRELGSPKQTAQALPNRGKNNKKKRKRENIISFVF